MKHRHDVGEDLAKALSALQFEEAQKLAEELAQHVTSKLAQDEANELVKSSDARGRSQEILRYILMIAETYFYSGRTSEAYKLLRPFTGSRKTINAFVDATSDLPMRERLQLVEYFYSKRELDKAAKLADQLWETVHKEPHEARFEEGEVEYFRVRIANRKANYSEMLDCALRGLAALTDSDHGSSQMLRVRWRLGQLLLVFGRGARKFGDPGRGDARLHLARWLLHGLSDEMSNANVKHALGAMYSAQGGASDDEVKSYRDIAKKHLEDARDLYERLGHTLNCSRIHRSLGIFWLSQQLYKEAAKEFDMAMNFAKKAESTRQCATINVWKSWLSQERENPDLEGAIALGENAINELNEEDVPDVRVDALLAIGSAYFVKHDLVKAEKSFKDGLKIAQTQKLRKHLINVHLSLAHLFERRSDIRLAWDHYHAAMQVVPDGKFPDSRFLREKKQHVKMVLEKADTFHLPFEEFIQRGKSLKDWQKELGSWLIKQTYRREHGKIGKVAEQLGIPRQRVSKYVKEKKV